MFLSFVTFLLCLAAFHRVLIAMGDRGFVNLDNAFDRVADSVLVSLAAVLVYAFVARALILLVAGVI